MASQPDLPTPWVGIEEMPVHFANAFGAFPAPNAIFLLFGSVMPLVAESNDGQIYAPVRPIARMAIPPAAVPQLIEALERATKQREGLAQTSDE